jgi:predicted aldo/keto reductase-like oxidoreductase
MEYAILGKTGRKVSRIGYGGTIAGLKNYTGDFDPGENKNRETIIEAIRTAFNLGINYFDTAAGYGNGLSEQIFGEALESLSKEDIFLATKVGSKDPDHARVSLERSLKNLRREWIDLIQIHGSNYSDETCRGILKPGGMAEVLRKAREEGLVRHIGFSIECQNKALYALIESGLFDVMQIQYNFIFQHPYDPSFKSGCIYDAEERNMGIVTMRTLTSGIFQKWMHLINPESNFNYNPDILQFNLSNPLVDVALLGMRDSEQVKINAAVCDDLSSRIDLSELHSRF